jgi:hypothetical protein
MPPVEQHKAKISTKGRVTVEEVNVGIVVEAKRRHSQKKARGK